LFIHVLHYFSVTAEGKAAIEAEWGDMTPASALEN
jgi:hypothetical protein